MQGFFGILYAFLFIGLTLASFFILFHLSRYTLNRRVASLAALLFIAVTTVLLFTNAMLFFRLPMQELLPQSHSSTFSL
jgi:hypothetical protein